MNVNSASKEVLVDFDLHVISKVTAVHQLTLLPFGRIIIDGGSIMWQCSGRRENPVTAATTHSINQEDQSKEADQQDVGPYRRGES